MATEDYKGQFRQIAKRLDMKVRDLRLMSDSALER